MNRGILLREITSTWKSVMNWIFQPKLFPYTSMVFVEFLLYCLSWFIWGFWLIRRHDCCHHSSYGRLSINITTVWFLQFVQRILKKDFKNPIFWWCGSISTSLFLESKSSSTSSTTDSFLNHSWVSDSILRLLGFYRINHSFLLHKWNCIQFFV